MCIFSMATSICRKMIIIKICINLYVWQRDLSDDCQRVNLRSGQSLENYVVTEYIYIYNEKELKEKKEILWNGIVCKNK